MLLQQHVMSLGSSCSVAQKNELLDRRCKLDAIISAYEHCISVIIKLDKDTHWASQDGQNVPVDSDASDDILDLYPDRWFTPEWE
jgi:hypothetical protein